MCSCRLGRDWQLRTRCSSKQEDHQNARSLRQMRQSLLASSSLAPILASTWFPTFPSSICPSCILALACSRFISVHAYPTSDCGSAPIYHGPAVCCPTSVYGPASICVPASPTFGCRVFPTPEEIEEVKLLLTLLQGLSPSERWFWAVA